MRISVAIALPLLMLAPGLQGQLPNDPGAIQITRSGSQPSRMAPAEHFTGSARVDPLFRATAPARASGALVTFERGARTAWHTHPLGQILIVTAGTGHTSLSHSHWYRICRALHSPLLGRRTHSAEQPVTVAVEIVQLRYRDSLREKTARQACRRYSRSAGRPSKSTNPAIARTRSPAPGCAQDWCWFPISATPRTP